MPHDEIDAVVARIEANLIRNGEDASDFADITCALAAVGMLRTHRGDMTPDNVEEVFAYVEKALARFILWQQHYSADGEPIEPFAYYSDIAEFSEASASRFKLIQACVRQCFFNGVPGFQGWVRRQAAQPQ